MGVLKVRVNDAWETIGGGESEVLVSDVDPYVLDPDATEELWYSPVVKQMFVRVNQEWRIATPNEVMVSRADPAPINPDVELWYDVDASPGHGAPKPPAIDEVWIGGQEPIKPTIELWYDTAATTVRTNVEYNDVTVNEDLTVVGATDLNGTLAVDGPTDLNGTLNVDGVASFQSQINLGGGDKIQFPNETGPKIHLYSTTFGIGVESGETSVFASSKVGFRTNASNGAYFGYVDANTGGGLIIDRDACDARYAQTVQGRSNSGFLSLPVRNLTGSYATIYNTPISYPSGNRRIKVTVQLKVNPGGECHIYVKCFGQETTWTLHAVMADSIGPAVFVNNGASGTSSGVVVEVKSDIGSGSIVADGSSWVLVEDLGPR